MITKMKKLTFLVYYKEYEAFLNGVRDLGMVHVAEKQQGVADNTELQDSIRLSARLQATEKLLQWRWPARPAVEETPASAARGLEVLNEVDELQAEKNKLQQQLQTYQKEKVRTLATDSSSRNLYGWMAVSIGIYTTAIVYSVWHFLPVLTGVVLWSMVLPVAMLFRKAFSKQSSRRANPSGWPIANPASSSIRYLLWLGGSDVRADVGRRQRGVRDRHDAPIYVLPISKS